MESVYTLSTFRIAETAMTTAERLINKGREEGMQQGIQRGISTGIRQTRLENARKMLEKEYPIEDIREITGLSEEEVQELQGKGERRNMREQG